MADTKISALPAAAAAAGANEFAINEAGTSKKLTNTQIAAFLDDLTQTLTNKTIDWTDNTMALTSLELLTALSDETGTGSAVFATSPTLVTPVLGTPTSGTLTNCTGLPVAGLATALTFTERIPLVMEVPEGTVGYPDINDLSTASAHISGMVIPDGASTSTINFKCNVPEDLAATPAASIKFYIMTQSAETSAPIRLTVSSSALADGENMDAAFTAETEQSVTMPAATQTLDVYDQDMTTDPTAGDILLVKVTRDPTDAADTYAGDPIIVGAYLEIDRTIT